MSIRHLSSPALRGLSLIELMISVVVSGLVLFGALSMTGFLKTETAKLELKLQGERDSDLAEAIANTQIFDEKAAEICNVYGGELVCGDYSAENATNDNACLVFRDIKNTSVWGCAFSEEDTGEPLVQINFPDSDVPGIQDTTLSFWWKDEGCPSINTHGCTLLTIGSDEPEVYSDNSTLTNYAGTFLQMTLQQSASNCDAGETELSIKHWKESGGNRTAAYFECFDHEIIEGNSEGSWSHLAVVIKADDNGNYKFANTLPSGATDNQLDSIEIFLNGSRLNLRSTSSFDHGNMLVGGFEGAVFFRESYVDYSYPAVRGMLGPIEVFYEALSASKIRQIYNSVYLDEGDFKVSMRESDFDWNDEIFGFSHAADNTGDIIISSETGLDCVSAQNAAVRICGTALEDNYDEYHQESILPRGLGRGIMFAKLPQSEGVARFSDRVYDFDEAPWALFTLKAGQAISKTVQADGTTSNDYCLQPVASDPAPNPEATTSRWERLTDYSFYPGQSDDGAISGFFFPSDSSSDGFELRLSTEQSFNQQHKSGGTDSSGLQVTKRFENKKFCQIAPAEMNFSVPSTDDCELSQARVVITEGLNPQLDQLYIEPREGYEANWMWSTADANPPNCPNTNTLNPGNYGQVADSVLTGSGGFNADDDVLACTLGMNRYYVYRDIPLLQSGSRAVYNVNTGTLQIFSRNGSLDVSKTPSEWSDIFQLVRYRIVDQDIDQAEVTQYAKTRAVKFGLGDALPFFPPRMLADSENGSDDAHYYKFISNDDAGYTDTNRIDWTEARTQAAGTTYCGLNGYLASVTSAEENEFIFSRFEQSDGNPPSGWLGGSDQDTDGIWRWHDGPEHQVVFTSMSGDNGCNSSQQNVRDSNRWILIETGNMADHTDTSYSYCGNLAPARPSDNVTPTGVVNGWDPFPTNPNNECWPRPGSLCGGEAVVFQNWPADSAGGSCINEWRQPDNCANGAEDYLQITGNEYGAGTWNDLKNTPDIQTDADKLKYNVDGYYIEFGGCRGGSPCTHSSPDQTATLSTDDIELDISVVREYCEMPGY